jgi:uncharacterized membrane protein (UPF0127 family)
MLRKILKLILVIALIVVAYFLIVNFWPKGGNKTLVLNTSTGTHSYSMEVSDNRDTRMKGLMEREKLDADKGMLFIFEDERVPAFWMKNMKIPLDIVFMDKNYKVVDYFENVPACTADPCPHYLPGTDSKYVAELSAGTAKKIGLKRGDLAEVK